MKITPSDDRISRYEWDKRFDAELRNRRLERKSIPRKAMYGLRNDYDCCPENAAMMVANLLEISLENPKEIQSIIYNETGINTMACVTECPECKGPLELSDFKVMEIRGVYISPDGFRFGDAKTFSTTDERVKCYACNYEGELEITAINPAILL